MANPVTDPELLAALNAPEPKSGPKQVTDPALLAVLEGNAHPLVAAHADMAPSTAEKVLDVPLSAGIGVVKGGIGTAGAMGDLRHAASSAVDRVGEKLGVSAESIQSLKDRLYQIAGLTLPGAVMRDAPSSSDIQKGVEGVTGEFYQPKTTAGEYAQTAGEFVPALVGGPEGIGAKLVTRVALPAVASETAGRLPGVKGTTAEPYVRTAAALVAPFGGGGIERAANAVTGRVEGMSFSGGNRLARAVQADGPAAVQARLAELGPDATLADAGPALLGKAQGVSLNSDEGRSIIQNKLTDRNNATNARIREDVDAAVGPYQKRGDPQLITNDINEHRTAVDSVNYPAALDNAPDVPTAHILTQLDYAIPRSVDMEQKALTKVRDMLMTTERQPLLDAQGHPQYDRLGNQRWQEVPISQNDPNVLHKAKVAIDNVIEHDQPGLGVPAGAVKTQQAALKQVRFQINQALEQQVPGYAEANAASAALAKRAEAVQAGTQYLGSGKTTPSPERLAEEFEPLSQGEKIAFAKGSRGEIERVLGTKANDLVALGSELQGEGGWNTAKIATVHGQDAADQLVATLDRNKKFRDTYNKVVENSQTAQRQAAAKLENPSEITGHDIIMPSSTGIGMVATGLKRGAAKVINAALESSRLLSQGQMAHALTEQGAARDARLASVIDALERRQRNRVATGGGNRAVDAVTAALLARQSASQKSQ